MDTTHGDRRRIVVTGGAGFLGSHLIDRLVEAGHDVVCVDNLHTGSPANIAHLRAHPRFEFLQHDVTDPLDVEANEIYNLACPASPVQYQRDPVRTVQTSVQGAINMLALARQLGCRILQASTSEVYGDPEVSPQPETYWGRVNPIGPRSCYDEGKRCAETLFFDYRRQYNVTIKVARIFNTYGPRMHPDDGRVVSNFVVQALTGKPITIFGDGTQSRSFCYVADLVEGLIRLMEFAGRSVRTGQSRQSGRVHDRRACSEGHRKDGEPSGCPLQTAAHRRPAPAPSRHRPCRGPAWLAPHGPTRRWPRCDDRLFQGPARRLTSGTAANRLGQTH